VYLPAGTYPSFSIQLKSHVTLQLGPGAVLLAAEPSPERGRYDAPEPNEHDLYQDFGHSHWQNSLIWGVGLEDVAILGQGRIDGAGLTRRGPGARLARKAGDRPLSLGAAVGAGGDPEAAALRAMDGQGNKAIALKLCRNVRLRGFSVLNGGHFAGSFGRTQERAPDRDGPTGRVKLGTESSGGFRNIAVSNCTFDRSRGLALETVDGGDIEDVTVTNLISPTSTSSTEAAAPERTPRASLPRTRLPIPSPACSAPCRPTASTCATSAT